MMTTDVVTRFKYDATSVTPPSRVTQYVDMYESVFNVFLYFREVQGYMFDSYTSLTRYCHARGLTPMYKDRYYTCSSTLPSMDAHTTC